MNISALADLISNLLYDQHWWGVQLTQPGLSCHSVAPTRGRGTSKEEVEGHMFRTNMI